MATVVAREDGVIWFAIEKGAMIPQTVRCLKTKKAYSVAVNHQSSTIERFYVLLLGRDNNMRLELQVFARLISQGVLEKVQ